jgi:Flp pilus assembly protein TadB
MTQPALQLRDIHLPPTPGWWPLAPGWWLLIVACLLLLGVAAWWWRRRALECRRQAVVMAQLDSARRRYSEDGDLSAYAREVSQLLRRVARRHDAGVVTQQGDAWSASLQALAPKVDVAPLAALEAALYRPSPTLDVDAVHGSAAAWLRMAWPRRRRQRA